MKHKIYFSTNTLISYEISKRYFGGKFRIWATPDFGDNFYRITKNPHSSNPKSLFKRLTEDVSSNDKGSLKIRQVKASLRSAAKFYLNENKITNEAYKEILLILKYAQINAFKPIIYILDIDRIPSEKIIKPGIKQKASVFSEEFIIEGLTDDEIKVIDLV